MWFTGTLLNLATVAAGGLLGTFLGDRLPPRLRENVVAGVGLFVIVMGAKFAIDTASLLSLLGAMLIGGIVGSLAGLERRLTELGETVQRRFTRPGQTSTVAEGVREREHRVLRRAARLPRRDPQRAVGRRIAARHQERAGRLQRDRLAPRRSGGASCCRSS